jgi:hypothetical protein
MGMAIGNGEGGDDSITILSGEENAGGGGYKRGEFHFDEYVF